MPDVLRHPLTPYFAELRGLSGTPALLASPTYRRIEPDVRRVLDAVVSFAPPATVAPSLATPTAPPAGVVRPFCRAVAWNIERGLQLDGILDALATHPALCDADLYFLTELDFGMARTANRDVPGEIARQLGLHGAYAPCYLNLDKGSGTENDSTAENAYGLHGNALFSRWPLVDAAAIRLPNGKDKMAGREKRIGSQVAVAATALLPGGPLRCVSLHLDAHSTRGHRRSQMRCVLEGIARPRELPTLLGGDWNTSTHNTQRARSAIIGFWVRVMMGVRYCLRAHYPHPDRLFERRLFRMVERHGFDYRSLNEPGACTLDHHILSEKDRRNLMDWLPRWCLDYVEWALKPFNGVASLKLDWFAGRGVSAATAGEARPPRVVRDVQRGRRRLSDHDPIVVDFVLQSRPAGSPVAATRER